MKTFGIHVCYKKGPVHPHKQENIHINTSPQTSTVQNVKNYRMRIFLSTRDSLLAAILILCGVEHQNQNFTVMIPYVLSYFAILMFTLTNKPVFIEIRNMQKYFLTCPGILLEISIE